MDVLKRIEESGVLPVLTIENAEDAEPLAKAILQGGINVAEVTFRTAAAEAAIQNIVKTCPALLLGAGTILTVDQCKRALAAGAKFIVAPGYDEELVDYCIQEKVLVLPGCLSPSDFTKAAKAGLEAVKVFPAEQAGGMSYIKAIAPVFPHMRFLPTGGINEGNLPEYLAFGQVLACGGSWMVQGDKVAFADFAGITERCRRAMAIKKA